MQLKPNHLGLSAYCLVTKQGLGLTRAKVPEASIQLCVHPHKHTVKSVNSYHRHKRSITPAELGFFACID